MTTLLSFLPEIALPPALRRKADDAYHAARNGLIRLIGRFGDPEDVPRRNDAEPEALRWARTQLRRLHDIVRYAIALLAIHLDAAPAKARASQAGKVTVRKPVTHDAKTWPAPFRVLMNTNAPTGRPPPPQFAAAPRDPLRTLARGMEALRRVLADPMPHARRLARAIRGSTVLTRFPALKRRPREGRDDWFEERREIFHAAAWALDMFYRPRRYREDSS